MAKEINPSATKYDTYIFLGSFPFPAQYSYCEVIANLILKYQLSVLKAFIFVKLFLSDTFN